MEQSPGKQGALAETTTLVVSLFELIPYSNPMPAIKARTSLSLFSLLDAVSCNGQCRQGQQA
ncbi:hypothetical protein BgiBS90_000889, partial [Biomphalaria glabrata]